MGRCTNGRWSLAGAAIGLLMGFFGVGGASVATPLLSVLGVPPPTVASPLPATIPGAAIAASSYLRSEEARPRAAAWSLAGGIPGTSGRDRVPMGRGQRLARGFGRGPRGRGRPRGATHRRRRPGRRHPPPPEPSPPRGRHRRGRLPHRPPRQRRRLSPGAPLHPLLRPPDAARGGYQPGRDHRPRHPHAGHPLEPGPRRPGGGRALRDRSPARQCVEERPQPEGGGTVMRRAFGGSWSCSARLHRQLLGGSSGAGRWGRP